MTGEARFDKLLEKATSTSASEGLEPHWESVLLICDDIREKRCPPSHAFKSALPKIRHQNPQISLKALLVIESIVKNCGSHATYTEVANEIFLTDLRQLYRTTDDQKVLKKVKELLQTWSQSFGRFQPYKMIRETVTLMTVNGAQFPELTELEAARRLFDKAPDLDKDSRTCAVCGVGLWAYFTRKNCRACGRAVCSKCSNRTAKLPQFGIADDPRVCDPCFDRINRKPSSSALPSSTGNQNPDAGPLEALVRILETIRDSRHEEELQLAIAMSLSETENSVKFVPAQEGDDSDTSDASEDEDDGNDESGNEDDKNESPAHSRSSWISIGAEMTQNHMQPQQAERESSQVDAGITFNDFREDVYTRNPGRQKIRVRRDHLLQDILRLYGRSSMTEMNLLKRPKIVFEGEDGLDAGALTKEFFYCGILALSTETVNGRPIFEGAENHRLPSTDINVLREGVFSAVGKFMIHSCIHTGTSFIGLSPAASAYIFLDDPLGTHTKLPITREDAPSADVQRLVNVAQKIGKNEHCTPEEIEAIQTAAFDDTLGFNSNVTRDNAAFFEETLLLTEVIHKRRRQLDEIKNVFRQSPLWPFFKDWPSLWEASFPKSTDIEVAASTIIRMIQIEGDHDVVVDYFKEFVLEVEKGNVEGATIRQLLECWTGSPDVRGEELRVATKEMNYIEVHACSNQIILPVGVDKTKIFQQLRHALVFGSRGYGNEREAANGFMAIFSDILDS